ncbi:unnamed protein product [Schistosoma mattheei]|uniref:Uncharacterized protein n=1 Tax=Schistosoma mattheei TaxID=31246 RepID=A0A183PHL4_9TREM|nr:unnamed protein product [Schistosoma mattheei]
MVTRFTLLTASPTIEHKCAVGDPYEPRSKPDCILNLKTSPLE